MKNKVYLVIALVLVFSLGFSLGYLTKTKISKTKIVNSNIQISADDIEISGYIEEITKKQIKINGELFNIFDNIEIEKTSIIPPQPGEAVIVETISIEQIKLGDYLNIIADKDKNIKKIQLITFN